MLQEDGIADAELAQQILQSAAAALRRAVGHDAAVAVSPAGFGQLPLPTAILREAFLTALRELWRSLVGTAILSVPLVLFLLYGKLFIQLLPLWVLLGFSLPVRLTLLLTEPVLNSR